MTSALLALLPAAIAGLIGAGAAWATMRYRINKTAADVNGLGRKNARTLAFQLRVLAEEDPISKAKLMHLADLIEPK